MQSQTTLGDAASGWLASFNYIGYLCGAIIAASVSSLELKDRLYRTGLILAVLTTLGMGLTDHYLIWSLLRFVAGLTTAGGMLLGSALVLNWLLRHQFRSELGIHFSGIGLGIALTAVVVEWGSPLFDWRELWWLFSLLALLLAIPAWYWLPRPNTLPAAGTQSQMQDNPPGPVFIRMMLVAYFCAGWGYVITATFIVAIVEREPSLEGLGPMVFLLLGLATAPACIVWDRIARKTGMLMALLLSLITQIPGILLPALSDSPYAVVFSAVLFGSTFIGIVSLVLTMAGRFYPSKPAKLMGKLTLTYGVAQIVAPAITGNLAEASGNFDLGLWIAAGVVVLGAAVMLCLIALERDSEHPVLVAQR